MFPLPIPLTEVISFCAIGALTGTCSGLLGIGGGVIIVPLLIILFEHFGFSSRYITHCAAATSLSSILFLSFFSTRAHHSYLRVKWKLVAQLSIGLSLGVLSGVLVAPYIPGELLRLILGLLLFFIAIRTFSLVPPKPESCFPNFWGSQPISFVIGLKSGMLGVGGGSFLIPWLTHHNISMRKAGGTSSACSFLIAAMATGLSLTHHAHPSIPLPYSTGYIYWPATLCIALMAPLFTSVGAKLSGKCPVPKLKRVFAIFLFIASLRMISPFVLSMFV